MAAILPPALVAAALAFSAPLADAGESNRPKLKWISASAGIQLDRWGGADASGNGFGWMRKNRLYNPPQTLSTFKLGACISLGPYTGLSFSAPIFRNTVDPYVSAFGGPVPGQVASGLGDIELALPLRLGAFGIEAAAFLPWAYEAGFLEPWKGFGAYRAGLGGSWSMRGHRLWAAFDMVVPNPVAGRPTLVEPLDHALKGGYAWKHRLSRRLHGKAAADLSFTSYSWSGDRPQHNYSIDPRAGLSFVPALGHEISLAASATLYSYQGGSRTYQTYASRRASLNLYYGRYL